MANTAYTTDGVKIEEVNGRIGDRHYDYTRLTLTPEAAALVMAWVPNVHASELPALIRKAHKGKLGRFVSAEERASLMASGSDERMRKLRAAITHTRNPRSWGFI